MQVFKVVLELLPAVNVVEGAVADHERAMWNGFRAEFGVNIPLKGLYSTGPMLFGVKSKWSGFT